MNNKERAAMQQALEALEELHHSNSTKVAVEKYNTAHNALREALAEQTEQEPVECERCEELAADKGTWFRMAERFAIRNEELKKALAQALNLIEGEWPEGDEIAQPVIDAMKATLANKPAPARTKDLTDDEIEEIGKSYFDEWSFGFARAVIAADREKNRG